MGIVALAPRVIIAGGGPGGLAAASLLHDAGAVVSVFERSALGASDDVSRGGLVVNRSVWDVLRRVGGSELLDDERMAVSSTQQLMSRRMLVGSLEQALAGRGVLVTHGTAIDGVVEHADRVTASVSDAATGARSVLDADWFVDASGGHTALSRMPEFARRIVAGPHELLPKERSFIAVQAEALPGPARGWSAADGSFAINDPAEGILTAYRGGMDSVMGADDLLRSMGVDPATRVGDAYSFTARQRVAEHAAAGRRLLLGDSVGTVMPVTQKGTTLALLDAERATQTIMYAHSAAPEEATKAIARYDADTVMMHRAALR